MKNDSPRRSPSSPMRVLTQMRTEPSANRLAAAMPVRTGNFLRRKSYSFAHSR